MTETAKLDPKALIERLRAKADHLDKLMKASEQADPHWDRHKSPMPDNVNLWREAADALSSLDRPVGVGVKPLEWTKTTAINDDQSEEAYTPFGGYIITADPFTYSPILAYYVDGPNWFKFQCASVAEAKDAAQSNYETRVKSALLYVPRLTSDSALLPAPGLNVPISEERVDGAKAALLALHKRILAKKREHIFVVQGGDFNEFTDALLNGAIAIERLEASLPDGKVQSRDDVLEASERLGAWLSAALDDPGVAPEMKADINAWFLAGQPLPSPDTAGTDFDAVAARAWDFVRPKLLDLNREKGPSGVWSNGFRSGWTAAKSSPQGSSAEVEGARK